MPPDQDEYPDSEDEPLIGCGTCHAVWSDDPEAVPKSVDGRVVVLRKADQQNNFIQYHSDIRSSKIEKIKQNINS